MAVAKGQKGRPDPLLRQLLHLGDWQSQCLLVDAKRTIQAKRLIKKAFEYQRDNTCFTFVELLSLCPTNWGLSPNESVSWLEETMMPYYPLGIIKEPPKSTPKAPPKQTEGSMNLETGMRKEAHG